MKIEFEVKPKYYSISEIPENVFFGLKDAVISFPKFLGFKLKEGHIYFTENSTQYISPENTRKDVCAYLIDSQKIKITVES